LRGLWKHCSRAAGERWWKRWYGWAMRSRLAPVKKVAATVTVSVKIVVAW
jgi:hypothetical protein